MTDRADRPPRARPGWRTTKRRLFPRGLTFTREGKVYVAVNLGVGFAAMNTANNLLFLVLGLMLGLIIVSGILSEISLRRIRIRRKLPRHAEVGVVFPVELSLENRKRRATSFSLELRDEIDGQPFRRRCYFLKISPGEERSIAYRCELHQRGRARFDGVIVSTRFPFGLFEKSRFVPLVEEVIVFPARLAMRAPAELLTPGEGERSVAWGGQGQEFRELRELVPGDDPRRIDWRSTARLGRPFIKENEAEARGFAELVLDVMPGDEEEAARAEVERLISATATVLAEMAGLGLAVRLITSPDHVLEGHGPVDLPRLLTHLALIDPGAAADLGAPTARSPGALLIGPRASGRGPARRLRVPPDTGPRRRAA